MARGKSDGSVIIDTRMNTSGFGSGVRSMQKQIGGLSGAFGKLGATIAATFAVGSLIKFGKEAIDLGSDLQEVQNVVDVTFSSMNEQVNEFAKNAAETAGLSETMAKRYTGTFGAMAKAFGFAESEAFNMSTSLTQLAGDVASFYNLTQDEAYTKLKSVFTGETETLKDLGVVMTQNALDAYAMAEGYGKTTKQMTEQEKVALRYSFVLDQLSAAQGDFVRTSDSWANQTRILSLNFDSFKANIGQALINVFTPFLKVINQIVARMAQLSQYFVAFSELIFGKSISGGGGSPGEAVAEVADGFNDITDATNEATKAQKKYMSGLDEIRTFNDEGGVSSAVGGSNLSSSIDFDVTGQKNDELINSVNLIEILKTKLSELQQQYPILNNIFSIIENQMSLAKEIGTDLFNLLTKPFVNNKDNFMVAAGNIADFLRTNIERVIVGFDEALQYFSEIYTNKIQPVIQDITDDLTGLVEEFLEWFNSDMQPVLERWGQKFDELWTNHIDPLLKNLGDFFGEVAENIGILWNDLIQPFISWIIKNILPVITPIIEGVGNAFMVVFGAVADVLSGFIDILSGVITFITGVFTGDWERAWKGLSEIFSGIWNTCVSIIEGVVNSAIELLNGLIKGVNKITTEIGIPKIPTIEHLEIPKLASGAVIPPNAPFMAMLGDQKHGTNIEAPLDTIKQAVREVVGTNNSGGQYQFTAQLNRRVIFDEIIEEARLRQTASGRNVFMTL